MKFFAAGRTARAPAEAPPPLSCDCHLHILGDPARYPQNAAKAGGFDGEALLEDALRMHKAIGFSRAVFVQPTGYHTDHSYLLDALAAAPRGRYRATAIIDDSVNDEALQRLHDAGVRGARYMLRKKYGFTLTPEMLRRTLARHKAFGWYFKVYLGPEELPDVFDTLRGITSVPVVLDHMCTLRCADGSDHPAFKMTLELLKRDNFWMVLSNGHHLSSEKKGWSDVAAFGRIFYDAAPDRCVWGSDWPHPASQRLGSGGPEDAELLELLYRYLPDAKARQAVLVDNPARLHGFE